MRHQVLAAPFTISLMPLHASPLEARWLRRGSCCCHIIIPVTRSFARAQLHSERDALVLRDRFPKSRLHLLVIARDAALLDATCLRREHLPLLARMHELAQAWATKEAPAVVAQARSAVARPCLCGEAAAAVAHSHALGQHASEPELLCTCKSEAGLLSRLVAPYWDHAEPSGLSPSSASQPLSMPLL